MLTFLISFLIAALVGTGIGGGGLYILYLTLIEKREQLAAQGINLLFFITGAVAASLYYSKKREISYPVVWTVSLIGISGSFVGSMLSGVVGSLLLRKIFGFFLVFCSISAFFRKNKG